ncbi:MAG: hypothetical protein F4153_04280 [Acidimicrobiia bacterium]|nr:hypothetical protein [Acidimicrobiia bacterium]
MRLPGPPSRNPPASPAVVFGAGALKEFARLIHLAAAIKGVGDGHTHTYTVVDSAGRPIHQCQSLSVNIDFENFTTLPPGYRTYEFCDDGFDLAGRWLRDM